jgi:hypothetical protein
LISSKIQRARTYVDPWCNDIVTCRPIARERVCRFPWRRIHGHQLVMEPVSVDTRDQQTFSWMWMRCIRGEQKKTDQKRRHP